MMRVNVSNATMTVSRGLFIGVLWALSSLTQVHAADKTALHSPQAGVLCDSYICADAQGVSRALTERYLGARVAQRVFSQGDFDRTAFTFANGIFCDTHERLCREDRYYGSDGKHSGAISTHYTALLFPPASASPQIKGSAGDANDATPGIAGK